ncbi:hypothetical protein ACFWBI_19480 [Streptomyces sp. NPDC059982]|uniref:hypothetical protein n=1 Tax=unclassified Streptomyces TaxID=2593676 RepID=UPI0036B10CE2
MARKHVTTALAAVGAAFILCVGLGYLFAPQSMAPDFGIPAWPRQDGAAFPRSRASVTSPPAR